ncbi:MAG: ABC transporter substrate-binding protein [Defluviitaleaceae bacterium]|nr:ABC transporter substrate-binding protein [Defluviitaleaceae bacterium]MCL2836606.1 ABC transporter substrate-binding protein [Defluviitaleaceae bacterium]
MSKKILAAILALVLSLSLLAGCQSEDAPPPLTPDVPAVTDEPAPEPAEDVAEPAGPVVDLPRHETVYFNGLQWGPIASWNVLSSAQNNAMTIDDGGLGARVTMFETLYMYNFMDNSMNPLLAGGPYEWNSDLTEMTIPLNPNAHWSDGTPVTAYDVAYTWETSAKYDSRGFANFGPFIDTIEVVDDHTILVKNVLIDGKPANPLMTRQFLGQFYILQKAWLEELEARNNFDRAALRLDTAVDIVSSGPYRPFFDDDTRVILVRDDNYWGQHESMWGKLPVPKYLSHIIYANNAAGDTAFRALEVDVSQNFIANVQNMWLVDGLPISTYMDQPPYGVSASIPTAYFNLNIPELQNPAIRKAIAMAVDYDAIIANAMTNQSPTFHEVPRSFMNPTPGEQAMFNHAAVAHLQWAGNDIESANQLLDDAGILRNADGWRELDGVMLSFNACAPSGWSDWEAAMEIVAAAGALIGIEITTLFPAWEVYQPIVESAYHTDYDIFMMWTDGGGSAQPWARMRQLMNSEFVGIEGNGNGNWGHYTNPRIDELIAAIPLETDRDKVIELYTEAVEIYLTDVPSFGLMYRPGNFHAVNELIWTGFTEAGDGRNVPPLNAVDGLAIADLYNIRLVNE